MAESVPEVILELLAKTPTVKKLCADSGYAGPKLAERLRESGLSGLLKIVQTQGKAGLHLQSRRWVVERTFAWLDRCRPERKRESVFRLAKDFEWSLASSLAWMKLAVCWFLIPKPVQQEVPRNPLGNDLWNRL